jgi:hypothetical protein
MENSDKIEIEYGEYVKLLKASLKLDSLESSGVDNWQGHGEAMQLYHQWLREEGYE